MDLIMRYRCPHCRRFIVTTPDGRFEQHTVTFYRNRLRIEHACWGSGLQASVMIHSAP